MTVPAGMVAGVWVSSLSSTVQPEMSAALAPVLISSIQSPGVPPFDSTSLIFTVVAAVWQRFAEALVDEAVVAKAPVPLGQRP